MPPSLTSPPSSELSPTLARLSRWYTNIAVLLLNTILAALALLFIINLAVNWIAARRHTGVYSREFDPAAYYFISAEEAQLVGVEFDQMGENESYQFNPWTMFSESPFEGELVNVEDHHAYPTRATISPPPRETGQEELLIWMFGGSTTFGWGVDDANTVASHLQQELQAALPNYHVQVINHGHAYYFSSLETSLYIALLRVDEHPDIVVFLDGLNDTYWLGSGQEESYFASRAEAAWEAERQRLFSDSFTQWIEIAPSFPPTRLAQYIQLRMGTGETYPRPQGAEATDRILEVYQLNRDIASATSQQFDIKPYFFLQPLAPRYDYEPFTSVYAALGQEAQDNTYAGFYDISGPLEGDVDLPYVDGKHYSDAANLIVAQRMAASIIDDWK